MTQQDRADYPHIDWSNPYWWLTKGSADVKTEVGRWLQDYFTGLDGEGDGEVYTVDVPAKLVEWIEAEMHRFVGKGDLDCEAGAETEAGIVIMQAVFGFLGCVIGAKLEAEGHADKIRKLGMERFMATPSGAGAIPLVSDDLDPGPPVH